jgi:hypothetical protein
MTTTVRGPAAPPNPSWRGRLGARGAERSVHRRSAYAKFATLFLIVLEIPNPS